MPLDLTKPVRTKDGRPVRILCTDREGGKPVIGLMRFGPIEELDSWNTNGHYLGKLDSDYDLVNVPTKRTRYCLIYKNGLDGSYYSSATLFETKEQVEEVAKNYANGRGSNFSCISEITFED